MQGQGKQRTAFMNRSSLCENLLLQCPRFPYELLIKSQAESTWSHQWGSHAENPPSSIFLIPLSVFVGIKPCNPSQINPLPSSTASQHLITGEQIAKSAGTQREHDGNESHLPSSWPSQTPSTRENDKMGGQCLEQLMRVAKWLSHSFLTLGELRSSQDNERSYIEWRTEPTAINVIFPWKFRDKEARLLVYSTIAPFKLISCWTMVCHNY